MCDSAMVSDVGEVETGNLCPGLRVEDLRDDR